MSKALMESRKVARGKTQARRQRKNDFSSIAAVDRAAQLLLAFTKSNSDTSLVDLSKVSGVPKPTAFRILSTLVSSGLVIHNEATQTYNLGFFVLRLADSALAGFPIRDIARPVMRRIRDAVNETVVLSLLLDDKRYNIDTLGSNHAIGENQQIGVPMPLHVGAASRVMLAGMSQENRDAYLASADLVAFTDRTITDRNQLTKETSYICEKGYATSFGEFGDEGHSIAVGVSDANGRVRAALHVSVTHARFTKRLEQQSIAALKAGVQSLEREIRKHIHP